MYGLGIENRYKNDNVFRTVVDQMSALLSMYLVTPSELREASILAATMHEAQRIRPLLYTKPYFPQSYGGMNFDKIILDEWKPAEFPAMFGGGSESGRIQSSKPNFTEQDKDAGLDYANAKDYNKCICGYTGTNKALHSQTCKDYNWTYYHPKKASVPEHCHIFGNIKKSGELFCSCGISRTYYDHEYNKKQPLPKIVSDTDGWRDDY
jgi:hypothetical protein